MNVVVMVRFDDMDRMVSVAMASAILQDVAVDLAGGHEEAVRAALTRALESGDRFTWVS